MCRTCTMCDKYGSDIVCREDDDGRMGQSGRSKALKWFMSNIKAGFLAKVSQLSRKQLRYAIAAYTGHYSTRSMLCKMGISEDPICRACNEDTESMEHILCECDGLARKRMDLLGVAYPLPEDYCASNLKATTQLLEWVFELI